MSDTLYEKSNTGDDTYATVAKFNGHVDIEAMTFTPTITHTITSVKLLAYRVSDGGNVGSATLSIKATSSHLPTGSDLASGTYDVDTMTEATSGLWYEWSLGAGTLLTAGTVYALLVKVPNASSNNCRLAWRGTNPGTYASGQTSYFEAAEIWTSYGGGAAWDWQFEEYGIPLGGEAIGVLFIYGTTLHYVGNNGVEYALQGTPA